MNTPAAVAKFCDRPKYSSNGISPMVINVQSYASSNA
jgi:hypothetical protein